GFVFVISSNDAMVMYRVDGVSGLKVFTGIKLIHVCQQTFPSQQPGEARPSILLLVGVSYRSVPKKRCPFPNRGNGAVRLAKETACATSFLEKFYAAAHA